jgi:hypothetical protein
MRLIKQDGRVDIPYERVIVSLKPHVVLYCTIYEVIAYATSLDNDDTYWVLGKYLTESKAKMVMALMRHACLSGETIFQFPSDDDIEEQYNTIFTKGREVSR